MATEATVDFGSLSRLSEQVSSKAEAVKEKGRQMLEHRAEYAGVRGRLEGLSDNMTHKVMVPMTSKAFMPGTLVHTNEVLVLLGDNWFIQTSAKKAAEIADRRIKKCDEILESLEKELNLVEGWKKQAQTLTKDKSECVEITEDYDEDKEMEWKKTHAENVKKERSTKSKESKEEEDLWQRLEELEVQEALEKEWDEKEEGDSEEEEYEETDEEESDITTDNISSDSDNDETNVDLINQRLSELAPSVIGDKKDATDEAKVQKRRVSWVQTPEPELLAPTGPERTISFKHSSETDFVEATSDMLVPATPSDLIKFACKQPKSILKQTDSEILVNEEALTRADRTVEPSKVQYFDPENEAVQDQIVERNVSEAVIQEPEPEVRKVSKFKAARMKSK